MVQMVKCIGENKFKVNKLTALLSLPNDAGLLMDMVMRTTLWKTLKCGNQSTETEVRKQGIEVSKKAAYWCLHLLTHECVC